MNKFIATSASALLLPFSLLTTNAAPMVSIGDSIDVFFVGEVSGQYHSNVFSSPDDQDDFVFIFSPGVEVDIGRNSNANVNILFREDIIRYTDLSEQNVENANVIINSSYTGASLDLASNLSFRQVSSNTARAGLSSQIVDRDLYNADITVDYDFSAKTYFEGGISWDATDFTNDPTNTFSDRDRLILPLNVLYRYSDKLSVGLGYRYRITDVDGNNSGLAVNGSSDNELTDHFGSLAIRFNGLRKIQGSVNLGVQNRENDNADTNETTFSINSTLSYEYSPKTTINFGFNRDFDNGGAGRSIEDTGFDIGATWRPNNLLLASARFDYNYGDFQGGVTDREDDTYTTSLSASLSPNDYLRFTAGYSLVINESTESAADFEAHTFNLSARLRY